MNSLPSTASWKLSFVRTRTPSSFLISARARVPNIASKSRFLILMLCVKTTCCPVRRVSCVWLDLACHFPAAGCAATRADYSYTLYTANLSRRSSLVAASWFSTLIGPIIGVCSFLVGGKVDCHRVPKAIYQEPGAWFCGISIYLAARCLMQWQFCSHAIWAEHDGQNLHFSVCCCCSCHIGDTWSSRLATCDTWHMTQCEWLHDTRVGICHVWPSDTMQCDMPLFYQIQWLFRLQILSNITITCTLYR